MGRPGQALARNLSGLPFLAVHCIDPASRLADVGVVRVSPELGDATCSGPVPFDISLRGTYNLALDAEYCHVKTQPLTADLVPYATAMKEYLERNEISIHSAPHVRPLSCDGAAGPSAYRTWP